MNVASTLAFPGSRTLAGWWRQLSTHSPRALWIGHLFLHRIEALAALVRSHSADPLTRLLLDALVLEAGRSDSAHETEKHDPLYRLNSHLHLGAGLLRQILHGLTHEGLLEVNGSGEWRLTPHGHQARETGDYPRPSEERREFYFVEPRERSSEARPHFLHLRDPIAVPAPPPEDWGFDPQVLRDCVAQVPEWKRRYEFPEEVHAIAGPKGDDLSWQQVVVDRSERLLAVMVPTQARGIPQLLGFAARQDGWALHHAEPAFVVHEDWRELFPEMTASPSREMLIGVWQGWARSRGLPEDEVNACTLEVQNERLRVTAPDTLLARLRSSRSDPLKGDTWLLAGDGPLRQALLLDITTTTSE